MDIGDDDGRDDRHGDDHEEKELTTIKLKSSRSWQFRGREQDPWAVAVLGTPSPLCKGAVPQEPHHPVVGSGPKALYLTQKRTNKLGALPGAAVSFLK